MSDVETLKTYVDVLPKFLTRRFVAEDQKSVVVSGRIPDSDASDLSPVVDKLDRGARRRRERRIPVTRSR